MVPVCGDGLAGQFGHHRKAQHVAGLALIGGHAQRGVAFQMFDRDEAFLLGQLHILDRHIVLLIDPSAAFAGMDIPRGRQVQGRILGLSAYRRVAVMPRSASAAIGVGRAHGQRGMGRKRARRSPHTGQARDAFRGGDEGGNLIIPDRATPVVGGDVQVGVPAARHAQGACTRNGFGAAIGCGGR